MCQHVSGVAAAQQTNKQTNTKQTNLEHAAEKLGVVHVFHRVSGVALVLVLDEAKAAVRAGGVVERDADVFDVAKR